MTGGRGERGAPATPTLKGSLRGLPAGSVEYPVRGPRRLPGLEGLRGALGVTVGRRAGDRGGVTYPTPPTRPEVSVFLLRLRLPLLVDRLLVRRPVTLDPTDDDDDNDRDRDVDRPRPFMLFNRALVASSRRMRMTPGADNGGVRMLLNRNACGVPRFIALHASKFLRNVDGRLALMWYSGMYPPSALARLRRMPIGVLFRTISLDLLD